MEHRAGYSAEEVIRLASAARASRALPSIAEGSAPPVKGAIAPLVLLKSLTFPQLCHVGISFYTRLHQGGAQCRLKCVACAWI